MDTATKEGKYIYCIIDSYRQQSFGPMGIGGRGDQLHTICFNDIATAPLKTESAKIVSVAVEVVIKPKLP